MLAGHAAACAVVVVLGTVVVVGTIGVRDVVVVVVVWWSRVSTMATAMHAVGRSHLHQEKKKGYFDIYREVGAKTVLKGTLWVVDDCLMQNTNKTKTHALWVVWLW